ncbi:GAF domain-containing protein, partial [Halarchaeum acidiphilum]
IGRATDGAAGGTVEAWAGDGESFLDHIVEHEIEHPLAREDAVSGRSTVADDVLRDPAFEGLRDEAMRRGLRSAIRLPLRHNERRYGFLELYARAPNAFAGEERDVFEELAAHIANALAAVERTETLLSGRSLELRFALDGVDDPLFALAERAGLALDVSAVAPHDRGWLLYASVTG